MKIEKNKKEIRQKNQCLKSKHQFLFRFLFFFFLILKQDKNKNRWKKKKVGSKTVKALRKKPKNIFSSFRLYLPGSRSSRTIFHRRYFLPFLRCSLLRRFVNLYRTFESTSRFSLASYQLYRRNDVSVFETPVWSIEK